MTMIKNKETRPGILLKIWVSALTLLLFYNGCGNSDRGLFFPPEKFLVWPEPPERPRIRYVGTLSTQADLEKRSSWSRDLGEWIFGEKKIGVLVAPYTVAVDQDDKLYVTDTSEGVVHVFDLKKRKYSQFSKISDREKLLKPVGIAVVNKWIYVVDSKLHKVCVFDKDGKYFFSFGAERLQRPSGIAYRQDEQVVYITDTARHTIDIFTGGGKYIRQFGSRGIGPGLFNYPTHLWVDNDGNLYVSDTLNYRIQVFTSQQRLLTIFGQQGDRPGNFAHPCGVATDSYGNIYVTDKQFENVQIFDPQGRILMAFGHEGTQAGQFWLPSGICIDHRNRIYVADSFNKRIQIFELVEYLEK
jgi:DNA-binding beta-propeller fold protein YncE